MLTVGDGDLSYSLALARAYNAAIDLVATTLLSEEELRTTYSAIESVLAELEQRGPCTHGPRQVESVVAAELSVDVAGDGHADANS